MKPEVTDYVRYRVARVYETLGDAELLIENDRLHSTVNRLHHACFYIVSALLLTTGLSSSKHTDVRALSFQHCIKTGTFDRDLGRLYQRLYEPRQTSDYRDFTAFERGDVVAWLEQARAFVARFDEEVQRNMEAEDG